MPTPVTFNDGIDQLTLCNMALSKLGDRSNITSVNENSAEAQQCRLWYKMSLAQTLAAFNWSFARARIDLTVDPISDPPLPEWSYRYLYPTNCFRVRYIVNPCGKEADAVPYVAEFSPSATRSICTNLAEATIVYTVDMTDVAYINLYPPEFINAFTSALAANMAFTLTGNVNITQSKQQEFLFLVKLAAGNDANEGIPEKPREAEAIRGRA